MLYFPIFTLINPYIQYIFCKILLQLLEVTLKVSEAVWDTSVESEKIKSRTRPEGEGGSDGGLAIHTM
jgi:hypothetical protein